MTTATWTSLAEIMVMWDLESGGTMSCRPRQPHSPELPDGVDLEREWKNALGSDSSREQDSLERGGGQKRGDLSFANLVQTLRRDAPFEAQTSNAGEVRT